MIYDAQRTVLSLPPIINGSHSAISLSTRNVFIECTATDLTKAKIVLNMVVTMFSQYCAQPFTIEPVDVVDALGKTSTTPDLGERDMEVDMAFINRCSGAQRSGAGSSAPSGLVLALGPLSNALAVVSDPFRRLSSPLALAGLSVDAAQAAKLLGRMQLTAEASQGGAAVKVTVPPTRPDVLHAADVMEDVAIGFGFNNIPKSVPGTSTVGRQQPLNALSDLLRQECAQAGYLEVLSWVLCSLADNFDNVRRPNDGKTAAVVANPAVMDTQCVRSSLLPVVLRTLGNNKDAPLPVKLFEVGDVVVIDDERDVGARNSRRLLVLYSSTKAGFEMVHGALDRLMEVLGVPAERTQGYTTEAHEGDPAYFPGRQARVLLRGVEVGRFGVVHPEVLSNFDVVNPCSALELEVEPFLALGQGRGQKH